jgi:hypothetical protein
MVPRAGMIKHALHAADSVDRSFLEITGESQAVTRRSRPMTNA